MPRGRPKGSKNKGRISTIVQPTLVIHAPIRPEQSSTMINIWRLRCCHCLWLVQMENSIGYDQAYEHMNDCIGPIIATELSNINNRIMYMPRKK